MEFQSVIIALIALGAGAVFLLVGYRFFLILLPLWGFFAGLWLGAQTIDWLFGGGFLATITGVVVGFVVGLILAVLSYLFYAIGVVLLGASFGFWFGTAIVYIIGLDPGFLASLIGIVSALSFASLTVLLDVKKHLVIILTSFGGASGLLAGLWLIWGTITISDVQSGADRALFAVIQHSIFWLLVWLVVAVLGIAFQERETRDFYIEYDRQYE